MVRGRFLWARMGGAVVPNFRPWVRAQLEQNAIVEVFPDTIGYEFPSRHPPPTAPITGNAGTASRPTASFVYLNVGSWIGSTGDNHWGDREGKGRHRDFGIVCGPYVFLCTFTSAMSQAQDDLAWTGVRDQDSKPIRSVKALLEALSAASPGLGAAKVRRMTIADAQNPTWPESVDAWPLHVILGDMHVPVLDHQDQTYGRAEWTSANAPDRVPRHGRVDLQPLKMITTSLVGAHDTNGLDTIVGLVHRWANLSPAAQDRLEAAGIGLATAGAVAVVLNPEVIGVLAGIVGGGFASWRDYLNIRDPDGIRDNTMSKAQAEEWYECYRRGIDGGKAADIHERAYQDLTAFIDALKHYADTHNGPQYLAPKLIQLGDMIDYWVGFTTHFQPSNTNAGPVIASSSRDDASVYGSDLVSHWTANLFTRTLAGQSLVHVMDTAEAFNPVYLWGNHDNYLGSGPRVEYAPGKTLAQRLRNYSEAGTYMEHGHQWEEANADNSVPIAHTRLLHGTDCPKGEFLTQFAFIRPEPIRTFEGKAAGAAAALSDDPYGQRLSQIGAAADKFCTGRVAGSFYVYVMGHTHDGCLTKVIVQTQATQPRLLQYHDDHLHDPNVLVGFYGEVFDRGEREQFLDLGGRPSDIAAYWGGFPSLAGRSWISLEDPDAPGATWVDGLWVYAATESADEDEAAGDTNRAAGRHTFSSCPPGCYVVRGYIDNDDRTWFRDSAPQRVYVAGMSLEGWHETQRGGTYTLTGTTFDRVPVLRWAWATSNIHPDAWFTLYRAGEPDSAFTAAARNQRLRPWKYCRDINLQEPWHGRLPFQPGTMGAWFLQALQGHPGHWEIRAFATDDTSQKIATVALTVTRAGS